MEGSIVFYNLYLGSYQQIRVLGVLLYIECHPRSLSENSHLQKIRPLKIEAG